MSGQRHDMQEAGVSLAELLVSLAILGLAASLLLAGLNTAWLVSARSERRDAADQSIAAAQMIIRGRLERMRGLVRLDSSEALIDAEGNDQEFSFYAPPMARAAPDALQRYRILLTATGDLVLFSAHGLSDRIDLQQRGIIGWTPTKLLSGVRTLRISYYGPDRNNAGDRWQAFWNGQPQPPELLRIRAAFQSGDARVWPALIVRPRATVNTACRIDEMTGRCAALS